MKTHAPVDNIQTNEQHIKNSKLLSSKQLQKRIQGLKQEQYVKIINNLTTQSNKLKNEVKELNKKVQQLLINRKIKKGQKNHQIEEQVAKHKKQLEIKYVAMNNLKAQIKKYQKNDLNEHTIVNKKQHQSIIAAVEKEISFLEKEKKQLTQCIKIYQEDLKEYHISSNIEIQQRIESLKIENKKLKTQIIDKNQKLKIHEKDSIETLNKYYDLKKSQDRQIKSVFESRSKTKNLDEIKKSSGEINQLEKEVQQLRKKKKQAQKQLVNDQMFKQSKKSKLQKDIRENLQYHKQLFKRRVKAINQLNMYQRKDQSYKEMLQKITNKQKIQYVQTQTQTQKLDIKQYRKDWVGKTNGTTFDDGKYNEHKNLNFIKAITIYKTSQYIVFAKFQYQNERKGKFQTQLPFDGTAFLKKLETKKLTSKNNGFLIHLSIFINEKKIIKIDFKWSDGQINSVGDQSKGTKYLFDILQNQRPLSMLGSFCLQSKNTFFLESLGCEISENE